ncbi:hypothetical protein NEOLEDRAFT_1043240, partial [Neolentinus lepideus HHB14362 ss-1]
MCTFIWADHSSPLINCATLELPISEGGLGLVNMQRRNKSVQAVKLKLYLAFDKRPEWAFFMDAMTGKHVTRKFGHVQNWAKINMFLQKWTISTKSNKDLSSNVLEMLKLAKELHLNFIALKPSQETIRMLPAWYHFGAKKILERIQDSDAAHCLHEKHGVHTV